MALSPLYPFGIPRHQRAPSIGLRVPSRVKHIGTVDESVVHAARVVSTAARLRQGLVSRARSIASLLGRRATDHRPVRCGEGCREGGEASTTWQRSWCSSCPDGWARLWRRGAGASHSPTHSSPSSVSRRLARCGLADLGRTGPNSLCCSGIGERRRAYIKAIPLRSDFEDD